MVLKVMSIMRGLVTKLVGRNNMHYVQGDNITRKGKCRSCYTYNIVYAFTNEDGGYSYTCEKCVDKVRKILKDKGLPL